MPRVSRRQLSKNIYSELDDHFAFLISSLQNPKDIEDFFDDFLSTEEKTMLTKRLVLHMMIDAGYRISHIHAVLGMSQETIRVHRALFKNGGETYKKTIRKIADRERTKEFWKRVEGILKPVELLLKSKTNMKTRAKLLSRQYD